MVIMKERDGLTKGRFGAREEGEANKRMNPFVIPFGHKSRSNWLVYDHHIMNTLQSICE